MSGLLALFPVSIKLTNPSGDCFDALATTVLVVVIASAEQRSNLDPAMQPDQNPR
jgi:hypothetical protein